ncbi:hypothetical protein DFO77_104111 [Marinilabilia salmonicolor]|uniref:Uncharacterized protein n=1 Tax=Marinilabilia salmonicolor TaxID=989 RepID=A0A368VCE1_9BACT|nr:hypothetical protein DFO77_104111 [Marinilabilia salmonicolor]
MDFNAYPSEILQYSKALLVNMTLFLNLVFFVLIELGVKRTIIYFVF